MRRGGRLLLYLLVVGILIGWGVRGSGGSPVGGRDGSERMRKEQSTLHAYVTLLYGDEFLLGVRVLGKSIRSTGATKDMVVLVSQGVTHEAVELLEADGWIVEPIELLANPNEKRPARFWGVYTKLKVFNMTSYEKVLYLDADTIVVRSIEDLFQCQKFCANVKHSERLNSGVMVVEPSAELFKDMLSKVQTLYSYTGGDQGFLNSYFADFANAHLFDPNLSSEKRSSYRPEFERLSTLYNADVGLYMLANKWMVDSNELRVVHYTLGPLKPWDWWTSWLLKPVDLWQNIRVTLDDSLPGTRGGSTPHDRFVVRVLMLLPIIVLGFCKRRLLCQIHQDLCALFCIASPGIFGYARQLWYKYSTGSNLPIYSTMTGSPPNSSTHQQYANGVLAGSGNHRLPAYLGSTSVLVCFIGALVSLATAGLLIPHQVMPWTGMLLAYEWAFFMFIMLFGKYLDILYNYGKSSALDFQQKDFEQYNSAKGHGRQPVHWDVETIFYGLGMMALAIAVPAMPFVLGVTSLFARLGLMVGIGLVLVAFMTYAAEHLAIHWFLRGRDEWSQLRSSTYCCGL